MNRTRLVAVAVVVGVLAVIGILGVWQRSEASDPQLGDAVTVKSSPSPSTAVTITRPAGSSRADSSADKSGSQDPAVGKAARPVAPAPAPAAGDDNNDADDSDSDSDSDNDSDSDSDD